MKKLLKLTAAALALTIGFTVSDVRAQSEATTSVHALILYDAPANVQWGKLGFAYAIMLRNLLGHFNSTVDMVNVQNYTGGQINNYQVTFYVGAYYANPLPNVLLTDIAATTKTVVWFKYNLWEMAWNTSLGFNFNTLYGFSFSFIQGMDGTPSASVPNPGFYNTVNYKGVNLVKYYNYDVPSNTIQADPDVGVTQIINSTQAQTVATIQDSVSGATIPYIIHSGNFWYVADMPFSYIGPNDRYLAICDVLHDMVGVVAPTTHRALVRLEDVGASVVPSTLTRLANYLHTQKIPFSVATIPFYVDPLGWYNNGVPVSIHMAQATQLMNALRTSVADGGKIVMHGYTHQYDAIPNKDNAVSGDDFEFWNAVENTPVAEDSTAWAGGRLDSGLAELTGAGFTPFAWEAPHYQSSPLSIHAVPSRFANTFQRVVYYTSDTPNFDPTNVNMDFQVGQFFPYIIRSDYYGQRVIPENLGNVEYNICSIDPFSCSTYTWQQIVTNAQDALLVRDGFASFFFHPFWLESDLGTPGFADFQSLVKGITALGYTWVDASTAQ